MIYDLKYKGYDDPYPQERAFLAKRRSGLTAKQFRELEKQWKDSLK